MFSDYWISIWSLNYIFRNYESEFIEKSFYEACEKFKIKISSILSYSPWDNVLHERYNQGISNMLLEICDDVNQNYDVALAWTIIPKIS